MSPTLTQRVGRRVNRFLRESDLLKPLRIDQAVDAETLVGELVENFKVLWPAERVWLNPTANERKFLRICKYFNDGFYSRPNIFTCEVPEGFCHIGTGLVCTKDFKAINESQMGYRMPNNRNFRWFKPGRATRLSGSNYATINNVFSGYWQHWLVDCLTRIYSLSQAYPGQKIILLTPAELRKDWKLSLAAALPANFEIQYLPADSWIQADRLLLPSYVSARANQHLPPGYYETMRQTSFENLGLPAQTELKERIYISRALAVRRRTLNEDAVMGVLERYGFKSVLPEKMDFKEMVDLFRRAEVVVGPYGSNWGNNLYSGKIKSLVLYGDCNPETHVFTFSKALGQEHFFVASGEESVDADFTVDLVEMERVLQEEMGIQPLKSN